MRSNFTPDRAVGSTIKRLNSTFLLKSYFLNHEIFFSSDKYSENIDYGNLFILNEFAEVPLGTKVIGRIQHGWAAGHKSGTPYLNNFIDTFVWSKESEKWARSKKWDNFHAIGAPWLYLLELLKRDGWDTKKENFENRQIDELWVYGAHSMSTDQLLESDLFDFLNTAKNSSAKNRIVLLSYTDYDKLKKDDFDYFQDMKIVTLGHRRNLASSNSHLFRLFDLLSNVKVVHIDHPSTLLLYAISVGCAINWVKGKAFSTAVSEARAKGLKSLTSLYEVNFLESGKFMDFADQELGKTSLRSPAELRELFNWRLNKSSKIRNAKRKLTTFLLLPYRACRIFTLKSNRD